MVQAFAWMICFPQAIRSAVASTRYPGDQNNPLGGAMLTGGCCSSVSWLSRIT